MGRPTDEGAAVPSQCRPVLVRARVLANEPFPGLRRPFSLGSKIWSRSIRAGSHLAAVDEVNGRVEDHFLAALDTLAYLDLLAEIACHFDLADMGCAILDDGNLQPV